MRRRLVQRFHPVFPCSILWKSDRDMTLSLDLLLRLPWALVLQDR